MEARPEAELFLSLGNWVGKEKKWITKKGTTTTVVRPFLHPPPFLLQILRKVSFFEENLRILKHNFFFFEKEKNFQDFVIFYKKRDFGMDFRSEISTLKVEFGQISFSF